MEILWFDLFKNSGPFHVSNDLLAIPTLGALGFEDWTR